METFSMVTGEFPAQRSVTQIFDAFWINGRVNHRTHSDVIVMLNQWQFIVNWIIANKCHFCLGPNVDTYPQTSNIGHTLVGNTIVDHSDAVEAPPVSAAPTTSWFST